MQLIGVARDSRAMRLGLISHSCEIPIYGVYKIRTGRKGTKSGRGRGGMECCPAEGRGRVVSWPLSPVDARGRHRNYANCGSVLACSGPYRPRKSIKTAGRIRSPWSAKNGASRGDSADVYIRAGRVLRSARGRARSPSFHSTNGASDLNGIAHTHGLRTCLSSRMLRARRSRRLVARDGTGSNWRGVAHFSAGTHSRVFIARQKIARLYIGSRERAPCEKKRMERSRVVRRTFKAAAIIGRSIGRG